MFVLINSFRSLIKIKRVMVSKEELRKKGKEELIDILYDLLIKFDKLTTEVVGLRNEIKYLKRLKKAIIVLSHPRMIYSD